MSEPISLTALREKWQRHANSGSFEAPDVLALIDAVEAAREDLRRRRPDPDCKCALCQALERFTP